MIRRAGLELPLESHCTTEIWKVFAFCLYGSVRCHGGKFVANETCFMVCVRARKFVTLHPSPREKLASLPLLETSQYGTHLQRIEGQLSDITLTFWETT